MHTFSLLGNSDLNFLFTFVTCKQRVSFFVFFFSTQWQLQAKIEKNKQRSHPQLAAKTSSHVISSRLHTSYVDDSHALELPKCREHAEFGAQNQLITEFMCLSRTLFDILAQTTLARNLTACQVVYGGDVSRLHGHCCRFSRFERK